MNLNIYKHSSGITGFLAREYKPTGKPLTIMIKLFDKRLFFAPKNEFEKLDCSYKLNKRYYE